MKFKTSANITYIQQQFINWLIKVACTSACKCLYFPWSYSCSILMLFFHKPFLRKPLRPTLYVFYDIVVTRCHLIAKRCNLVITRYTSRSSQMLITVIAFRILSSICQIFVCNCVLFIKCTVFKLRRRCKNQALTGVNGWLKCKLRIDIICPWNWVLSNCRT